MAKVSRTLKSQVAFRRQEVKSWPDDYSGLKVASWANCCTSCLSSCVSDGSSAYDSSRVRATDGSFRIEDSNCYLCCHRGCQSLYCSQLDLNFGSECVSFAHLTSSVER